MAAEREARERDWMLRAGLTEAEIAESIHAAWWFVFLQELAVLYKRKGWDAAEELSAARNDGC
ncbi:hypothetical protein LCGC14_0693190 [marine sediment metagenome]|uniref:Uncharacterized protein n=1 Tax=marine sediment metagenome TaxID=412755 RepID=A0A0F9TSU5_9ZZZZ